MRRLVVLAALLSLTACSRGGLGSTHRPIVVGIAGPFSQPRGVSMRHAAELAVKEVNARGGIRGRPLALRIMDDSGRADVAIGLAQQLVNDPAGGKRCRRVEMADDRDDEARSPVVMISPSASS